MKEFGQYIRKLRQKRDIGLRKAARELEISPSYLSRIEQNELPPPPTNVIRRFAKLYKEPFESLVEKAPKRRYDFIVESMKKKSNKVELYALYRAAQNVTPELLYELLQYAYKNQGKNEDDIKEDIKRLQLELPRLPKSKEGLLADHLKPHFLNKSSIEKMANAILAKSYQKYKPPTLIENIVENQTNINLVLSDKYDGKYSDDEPRVLGMSRWSKTYQGIREIIISSKLFESEDASKRNRLNFTLAHELFHAIEHLPLMQSLAGNTTLMRIGLLPPQLNCDRSTVKPSIRKLMLCSWVKDTQGPKKLSSDEDWREWQANYFAACILMPSNAVSSEFYDRFETKFLESPKEMNSKQYALEVATTLITPNYVCNKSLCDAFAVSAQAMAIRLLQLKLVK